jgi:two-component system NtrC family sensor kinase
MEFYVFYLNTWPFQSEKEDSNVVFLQHLSLTILEPGLIIENMPENAEQKPKKPDKRSDSLKEHLDCDRLGFGSLSESILGSLPIGVIAFDSDFKILGANAQAVTLIDLVQYIDKSLAKGTDNKIWLGWTEQLASAISTGKPCTFDDINYTSDDKTKLLRIVCTPMNESGATENHGGIILVEDVTEKLNIERRLANAERLAAVGKHASKVAHELNNPLDGILRYINLAMRVVEQENLAKPKEYLTQCRQGLMRMVQIISELLEFSRSTYTPLEYAKIEQIIEDAVKTMESRADAANVSIVRNYTFGMPQVRSGNLFQVFCNLAKNALDAMPNGGELRISTSLAADDTIAVELRDTGTGLPTESMDVIFEPFFTTKEGGKGTGLGLAICRDIVESCHGRIMARNAPDGGSIFTVYLPVAG